MKIRSLQSKRIVETEYLDNILLKDGKMQVLSAAELLRIDNNDLRIWCHHRGVYGVPSKELIELIQSHLVDNKSIEVGGGCGVFGRALGIPSTDSMIQNTLAMKQYYAALGQPTVEYGENVINLEASEAVHKFAPDVVFGSWVTQYVSPLETNVPVGGGSVYGLRETDFLEYIKKYIIYGNDLIHGQKEIFSNPKYKVDRIYSETQFFSRASVPEGNCLYIVTHA
jgi:hypothetical protein